MTLSERLDPRLIGHDRTSARHQLTVLIALILVADAIALGVTAIVALRFRELLDGWLTVTTLEASLQSSLTPWLFLCWILCLAGRGAYVRRNLGGGVEEFRQVTAATLLAAGIIATTAFITDSTLSRGYLILCFTVGLLLLLTERYAIRKVIHVLRRRGLLHRRVLAVGGPEALGEVVASLDRMSYAGYSVVGACVPESLSEDALERIPVPVLGRIRDIVDACKVVDADMVLVAGGGDSSQALRRIGWDLEARDIDLVVIPSLIEVAGPRIHMRMMGGVPLVHVDKPQVGRAGGFAKRLFDLVMAGGMILVLSPVMLAVALAIKLQDGGPVFYRQVRSGRDGREFHMFKFRSMVIDADRRLDDLLAMNDADDVLFKMKDDPRVTRVGRFIRRYSIDELPQLVNVLRSEMSLVGPRPPLPREVADYPADMHRRLLVRPGLTGLWQVSGRSDLPFDEAVRLDLYYVDNWSIVGDVIIILKTVRAVLTSHGAY